MDTETDVGMDTDGDADADLPDGDGRTEKQIAKNKRKGKQAKHLLPAPKKDKQQEGSPGQKKYSRGSTVQVNFYLL